MAIQKNQELIFGIHPILELLKARKRSLHIIYTTKPTPKAWDQIAQLLPRAIQIQYVSRDILTKMAGTPDHQGLLGYTSPLPIRKKFFDPTKQPFLVMVDGVQDTRNLGAIIRSAYCVGADGIIITKKHGAPLNASTAKASAGLMEHMEIYEAASAVSAAQELKAAGYHLYLATLGGVDAASVTYEKPACVVIGNEATGISREMFPFGQRIMIPQRTPDISYNASVAAGILFFLVGHKIGKI